MPYWKKILDVQNSYLARNALIMLTYATVDTLPNGLLTDKGQRYVEAHECHPVDVLLPLLPRPEGERVARGADVLVVPELVLGRQGE